jgi:hypothetical protein
MGAPPGPDTKQGEASGAANPAVAAAAAATAHTAAVQTHEAVTKPRCDACAYRFVTLPNQLRVLLISDPETDKAAAALNVSVGRACGRRLLVLLPRRCTWRAVLVGGHARSASCDTSLLLFRPCTHQVRVGSMSDKAELPGLAHFLEHMLFYSSEKYPTEDEYSKCVSRGVSAVRAAADGRWLGARVGSAAASRACAAVRAPGMLTRVVRVLLRACCCWRPRRFISDHGGHTNAFTAAEDTNYQVCVWGGGGVLVVVLVCA